MIEQAFVQKNEEDFVDVTERINEALLQIASDPKIKATQTKLADLAGVHRNTISNREWPLERLASIKAEREAEINRSRSYESGPTKEKQLSEQVKQARLETLYWFNKYQDAVALHEGSAENVKFLARTRDEYRNKIANLEQQFADLKQEYERVCDLLNMVNDE